ncbi:MAG TPA: YciI family protein [Puia sp.]|nr:YciI family protein [Puia sp.]
MKKYFALKLIPPRATFGQDMTQDERNIMIQHSAFWKSFMNEGSVVVFGPVLDPNGVYGLGIICVDNEEQVKDFISKDPANGLNRYEYYPMLAVVPENKSSL